MRLSFLIYRYRRQHDLVLKKLAKLLDTCRQGMYISHPPTAKHFNRPESSAKSHIKRSPPRLCSPGYKWSMRVDISRQLQFLREITATSLCKKVVPKPSCSLISLSHGRRG